MRDHRIGKWRLSTFIPQEISSFSMFKIWKYSVSASEQSKYLILNQSHIKPDFPGFELLFGCPVIRLHLYIAPASNWPFLNIACQCQRELSCTMEDTIQQRSRIGLSSQINYKISKQFRCQNLSEIPVVTKVKGPSFPVSCLNFGDRVAEKDVEIGLA